MSDMLSGVRILNIDNNKDNDSFGQDNLIEDGKSLSEIIFELIKLFSENSIKEKVADAILAGLILSSDNFQNQSTSADALGIASLLIKKGSNRQKISESLYQKSE